MLLRLVARFHLLLLKIDYKLVGSPAFYSPGSGSGSSILYHIVKVPEQNIPGENGVIVAVGWGKIVKSSFKFSSKLEFD
jgi:hypothetical protein